MKQALILFFAAILIAGATIDLGWCRSPKDQDEDFCADGGCYTHKGETCFKLSHCCKNAHDWATQERDHTLCNRAARKYYEKHRERILRVPFRSPKDQDEDFCADGGCYT